jgi:16S rRNA processing protein RimM
MPNAVIAPTAPADLIELGRITAPYGVKGWVKVQPYSADAEVLLSASQWWLTRRMSEGGQALTAPIPMAYKVLQARSQGAAMVAQLAGVTDRDQAEALRGGRVWAPRADFPPPNEGEYYWIDLIGCTVYGQGAGGAERLGVVAEVLDNGAHPLLRIHRQRAIEPNGELRLWLDAKGRPVDLLVPFVRSHIERVALTERCIHTNWPLDF